MDKDTLLKRLMETFLGELEEHVQAINCDLLTLEREPPEAERAEHLKTLFRSAHSLKGAARSVNVRQIEAVCHRMEEMLGAARDAEQTLGPAHFELFYAAADAIGDAGIRLREKKDLSGGPLAEITRQLDSAAREGIGQLEVRSSSTHAEQREPEETAPSPVPPTAEPPGMLSGAGGIVRIPAAKLDSLLAQSGELSLSCHQVEARREALDELHELVRDWEAEWGGVEKTVTQLAKKNGNGADSGSEQRRLLDRITPTLNSMGEHLRRLERDFERLTVALAQDGRILSRVSSDIDDEVRGMRMLPFSEACQGLERLVRDLAKGSGKQVQLAIVGGQVELDRSILDALKDPLVHLVRNAVDHGVDDVAKRQATGKSGIARITVSATLRGSTVEVAVSDDGAGLDLDTIRMRALKKKLAVPQDDADVARLVFLPGFSTSAMITELSGRGVGLDVVKSRIEALRGSVAVSTEPGRGAHFTLTAPLTLTTLRVVLVKAGDHVYGLDTTSVERLMRVPPCDFRSVEGREMILVDASPVPVYSLAKLLGHGDGGLAGSRAFVPVVVAAGESRMAYAVEELISEREVVVKNLSTCLKRVPPAFAATLLPSGGVALMLSVIELERSASGRAAVGVLRALEEGEPEARKRLLAVDDSVTARTLLRSVLEAAGYEVTVAVDGAEAWELLQEHDPDAVVSDVEMPRMDGFVLTEKIRGSSRFRDLPVVLVTARSSDQDKARGLEVGANAYLVKSAFDQKSLIEALAQLL